MPFRPIHSTSTLLISLPLFLFLFYLGQPLTDPWFEVFALLDCLFISGCDTFIDTIIELGADAAFWALLFLIWPFFFFLFVPVLLLSSHCYVVSTLPFFCHVFFLSFGGVKTKRHHQFHGLPQVVHLNTKSSKSTLRSHPSEKPST